MNETPAPTTRADAPIVTEDPQLRYLGARVPTEDLIWQDPLSEASATTLTEADAAAPKEQIAGSGLTVAQLISTAWAAASSFRGSDKRRGPNGARIRLEPQHSWEVNVHMLAGMP